MRTRLNAFAVLVLAVSLSACGSDASSARSDCAPDYAQLKTQTHALAKNGEYDQAQAVMAKNESCFKGDDRYWSLRSGLFSEDVKPGSRQERQNFSQAVNYLDKAIAIAPHQTYYRVFRAAYLIGAGRIEDGLSAYDKQWAAGADRLSDGDPPVLADTALLENSNYYLWGSVQAHQLNHAQQAMSPFLVEACRATVLRQRYADDLISIEQVFAGVDTPVVPRGAKAKSQALIEACQSFR